MFRANIPLFYLLSYIFTLSHLALLLHIDKYFFMYLYNSLRELISAINNNFYLSLFLYFHYDPALREYIT